MQQIVKTWCADMVRQLFGWGKPRQGTLILTRHAVNRMHEHHLDVATLRDVFRHGEEGNNGKITRQYANYAVGLYYRHDTAENTTVITTCWKGVNRG